MVLGPVGERHAELASLAEKMRYDEGRWNRRPSGSLCRAVAALPFEQFMGCVDAVDPDLAANIIRCGCGGSVESRPNANHEYIAAICLALLTEKRCETVTIATTNYDQCLERTGVLHAARLTVAQEGNVFCGKMAVDSGELRYVKLHGCVTKPRACVFTMKQYARALFDTTFTNSLSSRLGSPDVILAIGYSFSDPDLRPLWNALNASDTTSFFWNDLYREEELPDAEPSEVFRREFLADLRPVIHHSDLFPSSDVANDHRHLLADLAQHLGLEHREPPSFGISEEMVTEAATSVRRLSLIAATEMLARIVDSCCRGDAYEVLNPLMHGQHELSPALSRVFLNQLGHIHDLSGQSTAARDLRTRFRRTGVEVVARSVESFALSVGGGLVGTLQAIPVLLLVSGTGLRSCDPQTRCFDHYYRQHLFCKIIQKAGCLAPGTVLKCGGRWFLRWLSNRLLPSLGEAVTNTQAALLGQETGNVLLELSDAASAHHLLSQMLLVSERREDAMQHAERAQLYYSCSGMINGALQMDRVFGWIYLSTYKRCAAIRTLARGLWRALETRDVSLRPKLAADMMRALGFASMGAVESTERDIPERMRDDARRVAHGGDPDPEVLQKYIGRIYPGKHGRQLRKLIRRAIDPALYPIFLPNDPPPPTEGPSDCDSTNMGTERASLSRCDSTEASME